MRTFAQKQNQPQERVSSSPARASLANPGPDHRGHTLRLLQRANGTQAVEQMLQTHAAEPEARSTAVASASLGHDFSRIAVCATSPAVVQAKLTASTPGDINEQEADRVSEQVMRISEPQPRHRCASAEGCTRCRREQPERGYERLHAKRVEPGDWKHTGVPPIIDEVLRSPGQPIDPATRAFMEARFGYDFSHVRVHTDDRAADSARAVNALAYTVDRHLVFGVGQYSPTTARGRRLLAHELAHSVQQASAANPHLVGDANRALQRKEDSDGPTVVPPGSPEEVTLRVKYSGHEGDALRNHLWDLADRNVTTYVTYRDAISKSTATERRVALNTVLLAKLRDTLDRLSFARCVEFLGRRAPTFDELRKNSLVYQALEEAWKASNVGTRDLVSQPHEEGGWVFLNLIDGTLHIVRATPTGGNFITLNPAPDVQDSVVVAVFHTHPFLGGPKAKPSSRDKALDERDGVPDLVLGNTGTDPKTFQIFLSGPPVRKHLASDTKFPGRSGGFPP